MRTRAATRGRAASGLDATLDKAVARDVFWGDVFSRFADPYGNLWWVYKHNPAHGLTDESSDWSHFRSEWGVDSDDSWGSFTSPELEYIHSTLVEAMTSLRDPRLNG